jgi:hypothetical protein
MATITPYITGMEDGASYDGSSCVRDYLVDGTIVAGDLPVIGQPYMQQPDWPGFNFIVRSYGRVGRVRQPTSGGVAFDVLRVNGSTNVVEILTAGTLVNQVEKGLEAGESFQVAPEHIGARQAEDNDYGVWNDPDTGEERPYTIDEVVTYAVDPSNSINTSTVQAHHVLFTPLNSPPTKWAYKGCYVWANAYPAMGYTKVKEPKPQTAHAAGSGSETTEPVTWVKLFYGARIPASMGSPQLEHCPFIYDGGGGIAATEITRAMIGRSYVVPTFQLAYYRRTNPYYMDNVHTTQTMVVCSIGVQVLERSMGLRWQAEIRPLVVNGGLPHSRSPECWTLMAGIC